MTHMTLDELIDALCAPDQALVLPRGFANPHSYRGFFDELAFEPEENVTVGSMLGACWSARGETYTGCKGGEYTMTGDTPCWLALHGSNGGEEITPELLTVLIAAGTLPATAATAPEPEPSPDTEAAEDTAATEDTAADRCAGFEKEHQGVSDAKRRLANCKHCGRSRADHASDTTVTLSYRLEHRRPGETTWQRNTPGIGANWSWEDPERAKQRLAEARDRWPDHEHQLIEITTTVVEKPVDA